MSRYVISLVMLLCAAVPVAVQPLGRLGAAPSLVEGQQAPPPPAQATPPATATPPAGPGQGRGRAAEPIQEYPADPNEVVQALPGFRAEIVAKADRPTQGSWISITEDDQGRLILGANEQQPFTRLTLDKAGKVSKTETIFTPVSEAMGITWHDKSLYVQGGRLETQFTQTMDNPGFGRQSGQAGLHRLRDFKGDGSFTTIDTLRTWDGPEGGHSDHGVHEARVSPDGKHFYIINGNGVIMPPDMSPNSPLRNYADDRIIPLLGAQTGRLGQEKAPGGTIARTTFEGKDFHLFGGGIRNALHFDWNADGEIFSFDSDMEPEFGVPWYRPVRVFWLPSGADLGYRGNSGKYPTYYEDSLPPLVEIGLGSPVGVTFGYRTAFPAQYQKALLVADNVYGRIIAVHIKPVGSGYVASSWENFIWPKSLYAATPRMPHLVTDMIVARDGTLYYVLGNRRHPVVSDQSDLRRQPADNAGRYRNTDGAQARALRRSLEQFHWTRNDPKAAAAAWPHLGSEDRFLRFAARVALETVSAETWKARALAEKDAATSIIAMLALARVGGADRQRGTIRGPEQVSSGDALRSAAHPEAARHRSRRKPERQAIRRDRPPGRRRRRCGFPWFVVRAEYRDVTDPRGLQRDTVVEKTRRLMAQSKIYEEQFAYRYNLRSVTTGWTLDARKTYFQWFNDDHSEDQHRYDYREWFNRVNQQPRIAGNAPYLNLVRTAAVATLTDAEKADPELAAILAAYKPPAAGRGRGAPVPNTPQP